ncbi:hypothetical protein CNYM01_09352 [Colletotrichum nymphaeae SA-01]|uniref:Uncharacterized protein n=1 Tax=Colletotrichum nymphaeae SA-01 TaxID=1460502 RepID=A0A135S489_9PEZI|nr:hypothetical protein CNYM01_09352 [Colletotrichum nymphaeae SA-01]
MLTKRTSHVDSAVAASRNPRKSIRPLKQMLQPAEPANKPLNHTLPRFPNCLFPVVCGETTTDTRLRPIWLPQTHTPSELSPLFKLAIHKRAIEVFGHIHTPQIAMVWSMGFGSPRLLCCDPRLFFVMALSTIAHFARRTPQEHKIYDISMRSILGDLGEVCAKYMARCSGAGVLSKFAEELLDGAENRR